MISWVQYGTVPGTALSTAVLVDFDSVQLKPLRCFGIKSEMERRIQLALAGQGLKPELLRMCTVEAGV